MTDERLDQMLEKARMEPVDTSRVAYGLETRVMARLKERERAETSLYQWTTRFVWRTAAGLTAVIFLLGVVSWHGGGTAALLKGDTVLLEAFMEPVSVGGLGAGL